MVTEATGFPPESSSVSESGSIAAPGPLGVSLVSGSTDCGTPWGPSLMSGLATGGTAVTVSVAPAESLLSPIARSVTDAVLVSVAPIGPGTTWV